MSDKKLGDGVFNRMRLDFYWCAKKIYNQDIIFEKLITICVKLFTWVKL